jgi:hypothetical protein
MLPQSNQSLPENVIARPASTRGPQRAVLPAASLLLLAACSPSYELGELLQPIDIPSSPSTAEAISILVADGAEDADATLGADVASSSYWYDDRIGDVDGDGYDDWITEGLQLVYGGPRATGGTFPQSGTPVTKFSGSQAGHAEDAFTPSMEPHPAGDVDGDGFADILFESRIVGGGPSAAGGTPEHWATQRAYLWYGRANRPVGTVQLESDAVAFDALHAVRDSLEPQAGALQILRLTSLGDIDGDGFGDIAYSYLFNVEGYIASKNPASALTRIYYGAAERLPARGAAELPVAQLASTFSARPMGDIDGDGLGDFWALQAGESSTSFVVPGSAQRLTAQTTAAAIGLTFDAPLPMVNLRPAGDLDDDGIEDFILVDDGPDSQAFLFYGSPSWATTSIDRALADAVFSFPEGRAGISPLGDWNQDGIDDLMLGQHLRRSDEPITKDGREDEARWRAEARVILGASERYSGSYSTNPLRSDLPPRDVSELGGPNDVYPVGDIDGDGFTDVQLLMLSYDAASYSFDYQGFIKYGGDLAPLAAPTVIQ